jgi:hypothetical protein
MDGHQLINQIREEKKRYVLISLARCGSHMLFTALGRHPHMHWYGEYFAVEGHCRSDCSAYGARKAAVSV